jgi:hypothetical protein
LIALFAFAAVVYENLEPSASEVSIQALVKLPAMDATDTNALEVLADVLPQEIEGYSRRDILTVTNGISPWCAVEPDHLRLTMFVHPANVKAGLSLLDAMMRRSRISDAKVKEAIDRRNRISYWGAALRPIELKLNEVRGQDVQDLYGRIFRPDDIVLAVGGKVVPHQAKQEWEQRLTNWGKPRAWPNSKYRPATTIRTKNPAGVTTLDLAAPAFPARDAQLNTRILALVGLGTGKGSSLFRVARQKLLMSYRQESVLSPTLEGFEPRLILVMQPSEDEAAKVETLRTALLEDIKNWTEADRLRAVGMTEAVLLRATEWSPLSLLRQGPVPDDLEGRTFLRAYWPMKTGQPWDPGAMLEEMQKVSLADLKEAATQIVASAKPRLQAGK